jgi:hypothetical protein
MYIFSVVSDTRPFFSMHDKSLLYGTNAHF